MKGMELWEVTCETGSQLKAQVNLLPMFFKSQKISKYIIYLDAQKYIVIKSIYRKDYEKDTSLEQYLHLLDQTLFWDSEKPPFLKKTAVEGSRANSL